MIIDGDAFKRWEIATCAHRDIIHTCTNLQRIGSTINGVATQTQVLTPGSVLFVL